MDKIVLPLGDEYDKKCGDIYLTRNGNVVFHCTFCESKFLGFHNYFDHVYKQHYTPISEKKKTPDHLHALMGFGAKKNCVDNAATKTETQCTDENTIEFVSELKDDSTIQFDEETIGYTSSEESSREDEVKTVCADIKKKNINKPKGEKQVYEKEGDLHKCPYCEYKTKNYKHIKEHVRRHLDEKKHKCTVCEKAFFSKNELTTHTRTHTGERPYLCPECGRGFAKSSGLLEHVRRHKNIRHKECDTCKMKFYNAKELRIHKAVHSDARPFACTMCDKAFKTRLSLKTHTKIHANKREYQCNFCNASFNQASGLYNHINNKHNLPTEATELEHKNTEFSPHVAWC